MSLITGYSQIFQINISDGGVPKQPLRQAEVQTLGVSGDRQQDTRHHGGPLRAVSLFSLERILALQAEGHPIYPGSVGENITLSGLDWALVVPGAIVQLGDSVRLQVTSFAIPCRHIRHSFQDEQFTRISPTLHPGWARAYTQVLQAGVIRLGDPVILWPASAPPPLP